MVKVVSVVAIVVAVLAGALLMFAATKPDTFRVERSLSMKAPPEKIFPLINELRSWRLWSPYEKKIRACSERIAVHPWVRAQSTSGMATRMSAGDAWK